MKKLSPFLLFLLFAPFFMSAQTAERTLIASSGGTFSNASFSADYSVGEVVIHTFGVGSVTLLQGFQQPWYSGVNIPEPEPLPELSLFPNPGAGPFTLNLGKTSSEQVTVEVFDILGKRLWSRILETPGNQAYQFNIDLTHLATGAYHIRITDGSVSNSLPFVKVSQ